MRTGIQEELELYMSKSVAQASNREIYEALLLFVQKLAAGKERAAGKKKLYYISAEFLIGKLLSNNMINLGIYDEVKEMLFQNGKDICQIEEVEPEPSLGNGGPRVNSSFGEPRFRRHVFLIRSQHSDCPETESD